MDDKYATMIKKHKFHQSLYKTVSDEYRTVILNSDWHFIDTTIDIYGSNKALRSAVDMAPFIMTGL